MTCPKCNDSRDVIPASAKFSIEKPGDFFCKYCDIWFISKGREKCARMMSFEGIENLGRRNW